MKCVSQTDLDNEEYDRENSNHSSLIVSYHEDDVE